MKERRLEPTELSFQAAYETRPFEPVSLGGRISRLVVDYRRVNNHQDRESLVGLARYCRTSVQVSVEDTQSESDPEEVD